MSRLKMTCGAMAAALALAAGGAARADRGGRGEHGDHKRGKVAAAQAAKVPLADAIAIAERASGGRVAKIEIDSEHGTSAYEIKAVSSAGRAKLLVDTTTGTVLRNERKSASQQDREALTRLASSRTTLAQAVQVAERQGAGKAVAAGLEDEKEHRDGAKVYEVDVAANGAVQRVWVDMSSGQVVASPSPDKEHEHHDDGEEDDD
jgi:uncharacterized membrane protein YkoI